MPETASLNTVGPLFVDIVTQAKSNFGLFFDIEAPRNYKDPLKIQEAIEKKKAEAIGRASSHPYAGEIYQVFLKRPDEEASSHETEDAFNLMSEHVLQGGVLIGFDIKNRLRIMVMDVFQTLGVAPVGLIRAIHHNESAFDPISKILGLTSSEILDVPKFVSATSPHFDGFTYNTPEGTLQLCEAVVAKFDLLNPAL